MRTHRWRVLIVDDHAPSRAAVAEAVGSQGGVVVDTRKTMADVAQAQLLAAGMGSLSSPR